VSACGSQSASTGVPTPAAGGLGPTSSGVIPGSTPQPEPGGHSLAARPGESVVAAIRTRLVKVYRRPQAGHAFQSLANPAQPGIPLVFLVKQAHNGWLQVYVPVRPDGTTGWIKASHAKPLYDPYSVKVSLGGHRLTVTRDGKVVDRQRISVGEAATPTPRGVYFITELFRLINPYGPYGPYAFGLSGFSNVLRSFGGGPGQLAIHGTDDPAGIGSNVSHGCIHVTNPEITRLSKELPLGTPVQIAS
ncbi:MAG TPA: L,D-transpeptidase family protein, partial [Solirubrobacteraceae bacterium]|nr:L,D-transpeptidase family protein [Solirubrobacteraceae bacterium]